MEYYSKKKVRVRVRASVAIYYIYIIIIWDTKKLSDDWCLLFIIFDWLLLLYIIFGLYKHTHQRVLL